jgi:TetR/AcrR family transcriptional repressor of nem operon
MGRTSDARERLIETGLELFGERAYSSVGVAELASHAGVQKGSFYHFFPSKEALALAVIDRHWAAQKAEWEAALSGPGDVLKRLHGVFDITAKTQVDALQGRGSVVGCLFGNLAVEVGSLNPPVRERLQEIFHEQVAMIEEQLAAAVAEGRLDLADPHAAAKAIVAQLEGLILFAKLFNDPAQLDALWQNSLELLGSPALS